MSEVTEEDLNMVEFFIKDKCDVTRWTQWEERKDVIFKQFPILKLPLDKEFEAEILMKAAVQEVSDYNYDNFM